MEDKLLHNKTTIDICVEYQIRKLTAEILQLKKVIAQQEDTIKYLRNELESAKNLERYEKIPYYFRPDFNPKIT